MTENEQIEEMAKLIDDTRCVGMTIKACQAESRSGNSCGKCKAKRLHSKGYRKVERGEWIPYSTTMMECSVCKRHTPRHRYNFCPKCGADMRGDLDNE